MRRSRTPLGPALLVGAATISAAVGMPGISSASLDTTAAHRGALQAVVVKSWGNCTQPLIWDSLNSNWSSYGSIPISIDYAYPGLCLVNDTVTLPELEATGADVVILSDPSGNHAQYSADEAHALQQYANEGHNLIGTYLLLQYDTADNRVLAPLFGLESSDPYLISDSITPTYEERDPALSLFRDVGDPYVSSGYAFSQQPEDGLWSANDLTRARVVARTADSQAAILVQWASAASPYSSIYITNMPEYDGSTVDEQFFYNAIVFPAAG